MTPSTAYPLSDLGKVMKLTETQIKVLRRMAGGAAIIINSGGRFQWCDSWAERVPSMKTLGALERRGLVKIGRGVSITPAGLQALKEIGGA